MLILIVSTLTAVVVSFLCSLTEAVLLSVNHVKLETDRAKGIAYAGLLDKLRKDINKPIAAILILNTVAHTGGATIAGSQFSDIYGDGKIWIFSVLFTLVILLGTEILPKVIGLTYSESLAKYIAKPLYAVSWIFHPVIVAIEFLNRLLIKDKKNTKKYSLEDVRTMVAMAQDDRVLSRHQEKIIINTSALRHRKIEEIMLPIDQVVYFKNDIDTQEYFELAEKHLHTRYPISKTKAPDGIYGYLNLKEVALERDDITDANLKKLVRPILFVKCSQSIMQSLSYLNKRKCHLAMVQNEDGKNVGMITLEDIVEEIIGEIEDEFDNID